MDDYKQAGQTDNCYNDTSDNPINPLLSYSQFVVPFLYEVIEEINNDDGQMIFYSDEHVFTDLMYNIEEFRLPDEYTIIYYKTDETPTTNFEDIKQICYYKYLLDYQQKYDVYPIQLKFFEQLNMPYL